MSQLAQAGDSSTASPGWDKAIGQVDRFVHAFRAMYRAGTGDGGLQKGAVAADLHHGAGVLHRLLQG
jgi:hypothetical protein